MRTAMYMLILCFAWSERASAKAVAKAPRVERDGRHLQWWGDKGNEDKWTGATSKPSPPPPPPPSATTTTTTPSTAPGAALPKILCLHGGGGSASGFSGETAALRSSLSGSYEFVFAQAPDGGLWMRDPPSGKVQPTTDPDWAASSIALLD